MRSFTAASPSLVPPLPSPPRVLQRHGKIIKQDISLNTIHTIITRVLLRCSIGVTVCRWCGKACYVSIPPQDVRTLSGCRDPGLAGEGGWGTRCFGEDSLA
ncbi:hypothetical protein E2C01_068770 [Portunus trituberculatus]|uniref:Uncharacterized protein n=1 Tax=Portunus trituberculatus TaxID=210409 RepID=A0A5B7HSW6_PORTR|nr:hypothetical protein [Portunus trituberculatus]